MVEIMLLVLVLAVVYAVKAVSIAKMGEDSIEKSVSFSWVKPERDAVESPAWKREAAASAAPAVAPVRVYARRHPNAA
jgi:hypothetical protein